MGQDDGSIRSGVKAIRINKALARFGVASRRGAEQLIQDGLVTVNGKPAVLGMRVSIPEDSIKVSGKLLVASANREILAFYKPRNCVSTMSDPQGRTCLVDYFPPTGGRRLFHVGRLDYDAEGLLFVSNDGDFAQKICHPSYSIPKTYFVKVQGIIEKEELVAMRKGTKVDGRLRKPLSVKIIHHREHKTWLEFVIAEGINQHIKKFFARFGYPVLKIKRFSIGVVALDDLEPGQSRPLSMIEIKSLLKFADNLHD